MIEWFKKHIVETLVILILLVWAIEKLWPLVFYTLFSRPPIITVETMILKPRAGTEQWQAMGTVKADKDIIIGSEVTGTIQNLAQESGSMVQEGDILLTLRHADVSANLQKDLINLTQKQQYYQRLQHLHATNSISPEDLNQAESAYKQAEAMVDFDRAQLDKYIIKAPFAGKLGIWLVDAGQLVKPGDSLVTLTVLSPAYIDFSLPAKALNRVKVGDQVQFMTSTYETRIWQSEVKAIDPQLDPNTRSMHLRSQVDNSDGMLAPRLFGQVTIVKPLPPQLLIPQEAIIYNPQGASVYVLKNKIATPQNVTLGEHRENDVVILKGLKPGDEVVTAGMMKLYPGVAVDAHQQSIP